LLKNKISNISGSFSKFLKLLSDKGLTKTLIIVFSKWFNRKKKIPKPFYKLFHNKCGIEIGGPSAFFSKEIDIYSIVKSLDGVNFSSFTIWEGELIQGWNYIFGKNNLGYQYICDAVNLQIIQSEKYDFSMSCNNLEHIANPLKALTEMLRIIKRNGLILLVLPNKDYNFDHNRHITSFDHLLEDLNNNISEEDLTHLDEILTLHDLSMDPPAGDFNSFKERSLNNFQNRCLHHHVFDMNLLKQIFSYLKIKLLFCDCIKADYIIIGKKQALSN
jgi:SAM-dependent methyltransferase